MSKKEIAAPEGRENEKKKSKGCCRRELFTVAATVAVLVFALFVLLKSFGGFAWFAMSDRTSANGMQVVLNADLFEIAVENGAGIIATDAPAATYLEGLDYANASPSPSPNPLTYTVSSSSKTGVAFALEDETKDFPRSIEYKGIMPGSFGKIVFYVVPKSDGITSFDFRIGFRGLYVNESGITEPTLTPDPGVTPTPEPGATPDPAGSRQPVEALGFMSGHILLFENRTPIESSRYYYYSNWIREGFTYTLNDADKVVVDGENYYRVTLFWVWPATLAQMVYETQDRGNAIFNETSTGDAQRDALKTFMKTHRDHFFKLSSDISQSDYETLIDGLGTTAGNSDYITLAQGYNSADQVIGDNVHFIVVEFDASPAAG